MSVPHTISLLSSKIRFCMAKIFHILTILLCSYSVFREKIVKLYDSYVYFFVEKKTCGIASDYPSFQTSLLYWGFLLVFLRKYDNLWQKKSNELDTVLSKDINHSTSQWKITGCYLKNNFCCNFCYCYYLTYFLSS